MPPPLVPASVTSLVTFPFKNGAIEPVTATDPVSADLGATLLYVIYVTNPFHLAFGQPVSHCLTIEVLIPAGRGMLLFMILLVLRHCFLKEYQMVLFQSQSLTLKILLNAIFVVGK